MCSKEMGAEGMAWIDPVRDRNRLWDIMITAMNFGVPKTGEIF
jgi:hypothetical protein